MKKKLALYAILPMLALAALGASTASAHGWLGFNSNATPEQTAQMHTQMFQKQADLLGISVDEIKNAWAQGKTLKTLAEEKGISQQQLQEKMRQERQSQMKIQMQNLVSQGIITQAQADQRIKAMEQQSTGKPGKGLGRGMHGMGMGF